MFWKSNKTTAIKPELNQVYQVYGRTDKGMVREHNEDSFYFHSEGGKCVAIVADGMGGHAAGEIASKIAVDHIKSGIRNEKISKSQLVNLIKESNGLIYSQASGNSDQRGMGTTCTAMVIDGSEYFWAHIGDSRLYLKKHSTLLRITTDHTLGEELLKAGHKNINPDQKHVLTQALGTKAETVVDSGQNDIDDSGNERFLLCSDGLYDMMSESEILQLLNIENRKVCVDALVAYAKDKGGHDNITVIVIDVEESGNTLKATQKIKIN